MPQTPLSRFLPLNRLRVALAAIILLAFGISISVLTVDVLRQIENESESRTDNAQFALSQIEVELIHLVLAVDEARYGVSSLAEVRLRFDVFYSRLNTLKVGSLYGDLRNAPKYMISFARLNEFMERQVPLIDGPDEGLRDSLPTLYDNARQMIGDARLIALTGVEVIARASDINRREVGRTLILTGLLTAVLVASLVALVILLLQLYRFNRLRAAENLSTLSRLDAIVATAMEAIITIDGKGQIVDFNEAACLTLGYARTTAVGSAMAELITAQPDGQYLFKVGAAPDIHGRGRVRVTARHKDGRLFPAEMSISRTGSGDGSLYVAFLRDLSAQLAAEQNLTAARDEALAGEKAKADLLVVMSHEIRTPLNGMIGTIELLETTDLQPHQREYLRIMEASGQLLMHHVNDVLDIARLDSGKAPFHPGPVDLSVLVQEVIENQIPASQANGNEMRYTGPKDGRNLVICDGAQLRQVLLNLVGNAVKFTQNGRIGIDVTHTGETGPTEIRISDTGIGIPGADLGRIFDDFVTLDASYARRASGTGLGLGIVKRIVDQMGGTLTVDSQTGHGSTFKITLPLKILGPSLAVPRPAPARQGGAPVKSLLTLVVEDNEFNRLIVREMLLQEGHQVVEARDGEEGIALAAARKFDLVLMDISMPGIDGLQAAQAIIAGRGASNATPIVAMTAHALTEETARFRTGGMQQVLVKPITRDTLRALLADLAETAAPILIDLSILTALSSDLGNAKASHLVARFVAEAEEIVTHIVAFCAKSAPDQAILRDLHRLQGSAAMFGAVALQSSLSDIETAWKQGQTDDAGRRLSLLPPLWQQTVRAYHAKGFFVHPSNLR